MKTLSLFILTSFFYILGISTLSAANWKVYVAKYKQDKTCKLVVEVDGFSFHENRPEQLRRDALKDAILTKNNIPFLRLATNGSGERERIIHALQ